MRSAKGQTSLRICAGSPDHSLIANAISTKSRVMILTLYLVIDKGTIQYIVSLEGFIDEGKDERRNNSGQVGTRA